MSQLTQSVPEHLRASPGPPYSGAAVGRGPIRLGCIVTKCRRCWRVMELDAGQEHIHRRGAHVRVALCDCCYCKLHLCGRYQVRTTRQRFTSCSVDASHMACPVMPVLNASRSRAARSMPTLKYRDTIRCTNTVFIMDPSSSSSTLLAYRLVGSSGSVVF